MYIHYFPKTVKTLSWWGQYSSANVHIAHDFRQQAEPAYSIACVDVHRLQAHVTRTLIMRRGACPSGLMPVLPEAVSRDTCSGAVVPVLPEAVSRDGCGGAGVIAKGPG